MKSILFFITCLFFGLLFSCKKETIQKVSQDAIIPQDTSKNSIDYGYYLKGKFNYSIINYDQVGLFTHMPHLIENDSVQISIGSEFDGIISRNKMQLIIIFNGTLPKALFKEYKSSSQQDTTKKLTTDFKNFSDFTKFFKTGNYKHSTIDGAYCLIQKQYFLTDSFNYYYSYMIKQPDFNFTITSAIPDSVANKIYLTGTINSILISYDPLVKDTMRIENATFRTWISNDNFYFLEY